MKFLLPILLFTTLASASEVPAGCPVDDPELNEAVANGQKIACRIKYFTGGHGGVWVERPIYPNAKETIELACIDAQEQACPGIPTCYNSPYYNCYAE